MLVLEINDLETSLQKYFTPYLHLYIRPNNYSLFVYAGCSAICEYPYNCMGNYFDGLLHQLVSFTLNAIRTEYCETSRLLRFTGTASLNVITLIGMGIKSKICVRGCILTLLVCTVASAQGILRM